jgi:hypothetical protein
VRFRRLDVMTILDNQGRLLPETFIFNGLQKEVAEIIDRWYEGGSPGRPAVLYFKVKTRDDNLFILRHVTLFDAWAILEN